MDFGGFIYLAIIVGILSAFVCYYMANQKNKDAFSWAIGGLFLGIIAILILAFSKEESENILDMPLTPEAKTPQTEVTDEVKEYKQCPDCAEAVLKAARKCRYCGFVFFERTANDEVQQ